MKSRQIIPLVGTVVLACALTGCINTDDAANLQACKTLATIEADYLQAVKVGNADGTAAFFDAYRELGENTQTELGTKITNSYVAMMGAGETDDGSVPEPVDSGVSETEVCRSLGVDLPMPDNG